MMIIRSNQTRLNTSMSRFLTMRMMALACFIAPALLGATPSTVEVADRAPPTRTDDVQMHLHGDDIADPYRWLEDAASPEVQHWIEAQDSYADKVLSTFSNSAAMSKQVAQWAPTSSTRSTPILVDHTLFYLRHTPPQLRPVLIAQLWPDGSPRVIVDPNPMGDTFQVFNYWPSPSGRLLAYSIFDAKTQTETIHIFDVTHGRKLPDRLQNRTILAGTSMAWDANEKGLSYVRHQASSSRKPESFDAAVYHHELGKSSALDTLSFKQGFSPLVNLSVPTAEYRLLAAAQGEHVAMLSRVGDAGANTVFLKQGDEWKKVLGKDRNVQQVNWIGERLFAIAYGNTPRGHLLTITPDGNIIEVLAQGNSVMQSVAPIANGFLLTRCWGQDWKVEQYGPDDKLIRTLDLPKTGIGIDAIASAAGTQQAIIAYSGWTQPPRWVEFDARDGTLKTVFEVKIAADFSKVVARRINAVSGDSTVIPVTLLTLADAKPDGSHPTILSAYGAFGESVRPSFLGAALAWTEHGGAYAVANIRGGSEFGDDWHQQGIKLHKQNGADDFYAAAQALIQKHWTNPSKLGVEGERAGGLIIGMELTRHPGTYRAAVVQAGIYDLLRNETYPNGRYNSSEFGSVNDTDEFRSMYSYSPLQHVREASPYPAVLLLTGEQDENVAPWQSRKFVAALQAASNSANPILLLTQHGIAGHGDEASSWQQQSDSVLTLSFFAAQLGLKVPDSAAKTITSDAAAR